MVVLFLFFCSGATALVYEVIWSKYLTLLFGSTIQAQTVVLAIFMGGLALGNALWGHYANRVTKPLVAYGRIEIIVGLSAFAFPSSYRLAGRLFVSVGSRLLDHGARLLLLKGLVAVMLLLGPTILMGGTLPILAAWLQRREAGAGRLSARLYSANSLGAVFGAGLAGFFLVQRFGMSMTLGLTALVNVATGFTAIGIGHRDAMPSPSVEEISATLRRPANRGSVSPNRFKWSCAMVALTGGVSMGLEVLASRLLALIFGPSLQVFAIVLIAFILGISFGSALASKPWRSQWRNETTACALLLATAGWIGLLILNIENLAAFYLHAQGALLRTPAGYWRHQALASVVSIFVLGMPAAASGAVLPLWMREPGTSDDLGGRVGRLLTWNTLGAVAGVLLTGFVLMPGIGLRAAVAGLALILAATAIATSLATRQRIAAAGGVVIGALVALAAATGDRDWRDVFSVGVFRLSAAEFRQNGGSLPAYMKVWRENVRLLFYEDAADATVAVQVGKCTDGSEQTILSINGKPDASAGDNPGIADTSTQILLAQLPLMAKPGAKDVFCFGMGSGMSAGSALGYPIAHLTVAENCEPVLRAVKLFDRWNDGVATNNRVIIRREDARTVLKLDARQYDAIICEPSNPWVAGIASVFSREFYELAASRLKPSGIVAQWFHLYEMDDDTLNVVLRTFASVFPQMEIWDVGNQDIVLLGSSRPWESGPEIYRRAFALDGPRHDLKMIGLTTPEAILARQFASQRTAFAVAGPGPVESDDHPVLEYAAPRAFYLYQGRRGVTRLNQYDERTWQAGLAPQSKTRVLEKMSLKDLSSVFGGNFSSGNEELQALLDNRFQGHFGNVALGNRVMPCIFQAAIGGAPAPAPASRAR